MVDRAGQPKGLAAQAALGTTGGTWGSDHPVALHFDEDSGVYTIAVYPEDGHSQAPEGTWHAFDHAGRESAHTGKEQAAPGGRPAASASSARRGPRDGSAADSPAAGPAPGGVLTRAELTARVDAVADRGPVGEPRLGECAALVRGLAAAVFPGSGVLAGGARAALALDDLVVGRTTTEHALAAGPGWGSVESWAQVERGLRRSGAGSLALVLGRRQDGGQLRAGRPGHAWAAYLLADDQVAWINLTGEPDGRLSVTQEGQPPAELLRRQGQGRSPLELPPLAGRAVIVGASGQVEPDALELFVESGSTGQALVDRPTGRGYGGAAPTAPPPARPTPRIPILPVADTMRDANSGRGEDRRASRRRRDAALADRPRVVTHAPRSGAPAPSAGSASHGSPMELDSPQEAQAVEERYQEILDELYAGQGKGRGSEEWAALARLDGLRQLEPEPEPASGPLDIAALTRHVLMLGQESRHPSCAGSCSPWPGTPGHWRPAD